MLRRLIREMIFQVARNDLALFLEDHEADLLVVFAEEMQALDDRLPDEQMFIDLKMVPLGEAILQSAVRAIVRFLRGDVPDGEPPTLPGE